MECLTGAHHIVSDVFTHMYQLASVSSLPRVECKLPRAALLLLRRAWCNVCRMPNAWPAAAAMHHSASPQALPTVLPQYRCVPPTVNGRMGAVCAARKLYLPKSLSAL